MFARMATFQTSPEALGLLDRIREAATPIAERMPGWQGATQLVDRDTAKIVVIHYFDTRENMEAAEETLETLPQQFDDELRQQVQQIAGGRQSVEWFEVSADARR